MCCQMYTFLKRKGKEVQNTWVRPSWFKLFSSSAIVLAAILQTCSCAQDGEVGDSELGLDGNIPEIILPPKRNLPPILPCDSYKELKAGDEYYIQSPEFKKMKYPNDVNCTWTFKADNCNMGINCPDFSLAEFLCFDNLEIIDNNGTAARYCGRNGPKDAFLSDKAVITFTSSKWFTNVGFRCRVVCRETEEQAPFPKYTANSTVCQCGKSDQKVVGGSDTSISHYPWQAGLVRKGSSAPFCGGSLINSRYVLTAAHCVLRRTPYSLEVIFNVTDFGPNGGQLMEIRRTVDNILIHRNFTSRLDYDAALIRLSEPLDITGSTGALILPVCLPSDKDLAKTFVGENVTVLGWGLTSEDGDTSSILQKAEVQVISNEECATHYPTITERMLCAHTPGKDACQGDSGGPLMYVDGLIGDGEVLTWGNLHSHSRYVQIGIVSWGHGCAVKPGVYTRVTEVIKWIKTNTKDGSYCAN